MSMAACLHGAPGPTKRIELQGSSFYRFRQRNPARVFSVKFPGFDELDSDLQHVPTNSQVEGNEDKKSADLHEILMQSQKLDPGYELLT
jgi:hypothetical protein